jgi:hypothetical protein
MMARDRQVVGFDRTLELPWMDAAAGFVADGMTPPEVRRRLFTYLDGVLPGTTNSSARGKTVTVLLRIWSRVPEDAIRLRDDVVRMFPDLSASDRLAVHWVMAMVAYPYFHDVATIAGRLLRLHERLEVPQLTARLGESWGERELIQRTAQIVARTMLLWGVFAPHSRLGVYTATSRRPVLGAHVRHCVTEAMLLATRGALRLAEIASHPALFPFELEISAGELSRAPRLELHRMGLDVDQVSLRDNFR